MVMGGDLCSEGREFESQHRIQHGHFFTYICCKHCNVCLGGENKRKHFVHQIITTKGAVGLRMV